MYFRYYRDTKVLVNTVKIRSILHLMFKNAYYSFQCLKIVNNYRFAPDPAVSSPAAFVVHVGTFTRILLFGPFILYLRTF